MATCFVSQPFDNGKYDKLYRDYFEPAIRNAGLLAYRVDKDPSVSDLSAEVREGIKRARIYFAEISTDNPNVMHELGFADALSKDIVLVCEGREKLPFNIQHLPVIKYSTGPGSDPEAFRQAITERLKALMQKRANKQAKQSKPAEEKWELPVLTDSEIAMVGMLHTGQLSGQPTTTAAKLYRAMSARGFAQRTSARVFERLKEMGLIEPTENTTHGGDDLVVFQLSKQGNYWVKKNRDKIAAQSKPATSGVKEKPVIPAAKPYIAPAPTPKKESWWDRFWGDADAYHFVS